MYNNYNTVHDRRISNRRRTNKINSYYFYYEFGANLASIIMPELRLVVIFGTNLVSNISIKASKKGLYF